MKKIILLALSALMMVGCYDRQSKVVDGVDVVVIDSCEYIRRPTYYGYNVYNHKGNCRFCEERDSIKWEKRKKELEELVIKLK